MIIGFAKAAPEEVRAMFIALFDESKDVYERMDSFKAQSSILLEKYGIEKDKSLGKGFCIGHSYFCGLADCSDLELRSIVDYDIIPMLSEYWFDEPTKLQEWTNRLLGVFQK